MILERLKRWSMAECFDDDSDYMEVNENSNLELKESNKKNISSDNEVHPWLKRILKIIKIMLLQCLESAILQKWL